VGPRSKRAGEGRAKHRHSNRRQLGGARGDAKGQHVKPAIDPRKKVTESHHVESGNPVGEQSVVRLKRGTHKKQNLAIEKEVFTKYRSRALK